jgi:hypothetical protein
MKILFVSKFDLPDFQSDMVFHGLRSLYGEDCIDSNEAWYMYHNMRSSWNERVPENGMSYGRGFTLYGRLPKLDIDRTNIKEKIVDRYFDKIVYGSITRCQDFLDEVIKVYQKEDILFIDGEDSQSINDRYSSIGKYFKRELIYSNVKNVYPINFCIPEELVLDSVPQKYKDYSTVIPGDLSTYVFTEESEYFKDYQDSYFGITIKKGGWDCLRHYEILMNGCIPYFPDLDRCPEKTMVIFPKKEILQINSYIQKESISSSLYEEWMMRLLMHTKDKLTTKSVAKYIIQ